MSYGYQFLSIKAAQVFARYFIIADDSVKYESSCQRIGIYYIGFFYARKPFFCSPEIKFTSLKLNGIFAEATNINMARVNGQHKFPKIKGSKLIFKNISTLLI